MINLTLAQQWVDQSTAYLAACWSLPYSAPACLPLWYWVASASMSAGALLILRGAWSAVDYWLKYRAALRAQEARDKVADADVMQQHTWDGDNAILQMPVEAGDDMAARIRDELVRKKLRESGMVPPGPRA